MSKSRTKFKCGMHTIQVLEGEYMDGGKPTQAARKFAENIVGMIDRIRSYASRKLRSKYNAAWRDDDSPKLDESDFCELLGKPTIVLYDEEGAATVYFSPKHMFDGHGVQVSLNNGKAYHATIVG